MGSRRELFTLAAALIVSAPVPAQTGAPAPAQAPQIDLDRLKRPGAAQPSKELFGSKSWEPPRVRDTRPPPPPPPPEAPPVPFAFVGKWLEGGETIVVLAKERQHYIAHAGDKLDGTYLLEAIEGDKVVLRYLPLNIAQVLPFSSGRPAAQVPMVPQTYNDRGRQRLPARDPDDEED